MFIQYKGKGILVLLYVAASTAGLLILTKVIEENCFEGQLHSSVYQLVLAFGILLAGLWTFLTSYDSYRDENGEKKFIDLDHRLYFIRMRYWAYILFGIGGLVLIDGAYNFIRHLSYIL